MVRPGVTRQLIRSVRRVTGIRLTIFLPLFLMGLVVAVGLWAIRLTTAAVGKSSISQLSVAEIQALRETAFLVVGVGGGGALLLGILLAIAISRPIRTLLKRSERVIPVSLPRAPVKKIDELSSLSNTLNHLLLSFEKYARVSDIFDRLPEGILAVSPGGEILGANAEAQRIFGQGPDGLVGTRLADLVERGQAENDRFLGLWQRAVDRTPTTFSHLTLQRKDGTRVDVRGSLALSESPGGPGEEVILTVQDLARVRTIQGEVRRVDQLAALGALAASIVHEIGGAVLAIQTLVDLIASQIPEQSPQSRYAEKIQGELDRIRRLADEIRTLAQVELREPVPCQVENLVAETLWLAETRFREKGITATKRIAADLPPVLGDPDRLSRAFLNILTNAFEATPAGGRVAVEVAEEAAPDDLGAGRLIAVRIVNTGSHIPPRDLDRIFDLFYTTKKEGSGLGLPVAARAVADHGGKITARSSPEEGTQFTLFLPAARAAAPP
ncbi:MAG: PAS domain-containing protein [Candidatus Rokubacteria bacterium]|nr:PAS domain-containing protein [Candidatus Rokubacteria bacterium]